LTFPTRALTGQQVMCSEEKWRQQGFEFGRVGGFFAKPNRPGFGLEDYRHTVVKLSAQLAAPS
jgi:hypothetical protein